MFIAISSLPSVDPDTVRKYRIVAIKDSSLNLPKRNSNILDKQHLLTVSNFEDKTYTLLKGIGIGYTPTFLAKPLVDSGKLQCIDTRDEPLDGDIVMAWNNANKGKALHWFIDNLAKASIGNIS